MLVSVSTFAFILAYWVAALSPSKATLAHTGFYISFAVWVALSVALLVPYRVLINESQSTSKLHNLLKAFLGTAYFLHLIVAVFLVIVGVKLASHAQSSGKLDADSKKGVIRLYFLLGVIALVSVVRVGVALYYSLIWVAAVGNQEKIFIFIFFIMIIIFFLCVFFLFLKVPMHCCGQHTIS